VVFEMRWTYPKVSQEILATQWRISELGWIGSIVGFGLQYKIKSGSLKVCMYRMVKSLIPMVQRKRIHWGFTLLYIYFILRHGTFGSTHPQSPSNTVEKVSKSNIDKLETVIMRPQLPCTSKRWDHAKVYNSSKCQSWLCIHWHTPLSHMVSGQWSHNLVPINLMAADQPLTNWHISRQLQLFFWISLSCIYIYSMI
jgi:hypothetical protein